MLKRLALLASLSLVPLAHASEGATSSWQQARAGNEIGNIASLQRGARNFMGYCAGCHSLKYKRYSRLAQDLKIPEDQLEQNLLLPGDKPSDYILTSLSTADGEAWFGKTPPDLSLITRAKGADYVYRFLKTFYANPDPKSVTGVDNLQLPGTAMPHVLAALGGVHEAVFENVETQVDGKPMVEKRFVEFKPGVAGALSDAEYDQFVRDTVNFLDYVGEPAQLVRTGLGIWVVLFLLLFTAIAYLLKQEYWKDVK